MQEVSVKFCELLRKGDEEAAFALLTPENVNWRIDEGYFRDLTILTEFLYHKDIPDNPRVIDYVFKLGFRFNKDEDEDVDYDDDICYGIKNAICSGKIKTARALSFYYPCTLNEFAYSHCSYEYPNYVPRIIMIDLGYPDKYGVFKAHLESVRMLAIVTMGAISRSPPPLRGGGVRRDVARIIGRVIWESRALNFKR